MGFNVSTLDRGFDYMLKAFIWKGFQSLEF